MDNRGKDSTETRKGLVIIEDPEIKDRLDGICLEIWPDLKAHLEKSDYTYSPVSDPLIETKLSHVLVRSMVVMLFDVQSAICRIKLDCSMENWMIGNEFFLSLPANVDFRYIHELLGNSRLSGNPPSLMVYKNNPAAYYQITFESGRGESWTVHNNLYLLDKLKRSIDVNIELFETMADGEVNEEIVAEFLTKAYEIYEAY